MKLSRNLAKKASNGYYRMEIGVYYLLIGVGHGVSKPAHCKSIEDYTHVQFHIRYKKSNCVLLSQQLRPLGITLGNSHYENFCPVEEIMKIAEKLNGGPINILGNF